MLNYLDKLDSLIKSGALGIEFLTVADIRHDEDCPMLEGIRECNCDPDIYLGDKKISQQTDNPHGVSVDGGRGTGQLLLPFPPSSDIYRVYSPNFVGWTQIER